MVLAPLGPIQVTGPEDLINLGCILLGPECQYHTECSICLRLGWVCCNVSRHELVEVPCLLALVDVVDQIFRGIVLGSRCFFLTFQILLVKSPESFRFTEHLLPINSISCDREESS